MEQLSDFLAKRVAKYELPVFIKQVNELPVTQNGKVRKSELSKWAEEGRI